MTVREARKEAVKRLLSADFSKQVSPTAALDADCILCNILHTNRSFLLAHDDKALSPSEQKTFFKHIAQRGEGLPVAYITGHKEFFGFDFCVSPAVLIPKPDTELLVERTLAEIEKRAAALKKSADGYARNCTGTAQAHGGKPQLYIADVCTGSGCVILSILKTLEQKNADLLKIIRLACCASDISEAALYIARKNAARLLDGSAVGKPRFLCADLLCFRRPPGRVNENRYDIIVSNPPYVPSGIAAELLQDGRNEPLLALDGGKDGMDIIQRLITQAHCALKNGGVLLLETGEYNAGGTRQALTNAGFSDIITFNDLSGLPRVTTAQNSMSDFQLNKTVTDSAVLLDTFFREYPDYTGSDAELIKSGWDFLCKAAGTKQRPDGEPYILHPMRVACILAENKLDAEGITAGFLHNIFTLENVDTAAAEKTFPPEVINIIRATHRITGLNMHSKTLEQADSFRKMLFAMTDDIRVILVKMADRLDRIRSIAALQSDEQKQLSAEIIEIWAPLANRLGMSAVKIEMEDLSLKYSNPDVFAQLKRIVALKKSERSEYLEKAQKEIYKAASRAGLEVTVYGRAKHFYSIYQKMKKKNRTAEELLDLLAMRILCKTVADCYVMIGLVHNLWKPLEGRFKDYIAMPKANGYQSIHTTVLCGTRPLEIQIRTNEMHAVAEHGVASHWLYKKGMNKDTVDIDNLAIINQLRELRKDHLTDTEFFNEIKNELLGDSIFAFTPKGEVRKLPRGSTAIDFAYSIHTHIGETITGAKADGHIIPLSKPLKNTQIIEILTNPQAHPTGNQLTQVKTARARSKIRAWLAANAPLETKETAKTRDTEGQKTESPKSTQTVSEQPCTDTVLSGSDAAGSAALRQESGADAPVKIRIGDTANFLASTAKCCNPQYGDEIVGYVSRGRGIIVHRADCKNFSRIENVAQRTLPVMWKEGTAKSPSAVKTAVSKKTPLK